MYIEPEVEALFLLAEPFTQSYFSFLNEYERLRDQYFAFYRVLEKPLDTNSLHTLKQLLKTGAKLERLHTLQAFREGVRLERERKKVKRP